MGVTNEHSLGWAIAEKLHAAGAEIAFSYQGERLKEKIEKLTEGWGSTLYEVDVTNTAALKAMFDDLKSKWSTLDFLVHSIAYAPKPAMEGRFIDTTSDDWNTALNVSAYSLVAICREAESMLADGSSIVTLTFHASQRVFPKYNVMGVAKAALEASIRFLANELGKKNVRINGVSAGAIRTVAAMSIPGFRRMGAKYVATAPLGRLVTHEEVGNLGFYLLSPLSSGSTGQVMYVDGGYSSMGMSFDPGEEKE